MTIDEMCEYIRMQFIEDCKWEVTVTYSEDTETYTATDNETHATVTAQVGSDDEELIFVTAQNREVLRCPIPTLDNEEDEFVEGIEQLGEVQALDHHSETDSLGDNSDDEYE